MSFLARVYAIARRHGETRAERRAIRRALVAQSFTRFLARKPIGFGALGERGAAWRKELDAWRARWAAARANSTTVRRSP